MTPADAAAALAAGLAAAKEYTDLVVKPPLEQLGELLSERVGLWRLKNRVNCLLEAKRFLEAKGIRPEKLLPSVFVPLLEEAGNTDDPELSKMFARLLATQLDPATQEIVHPAFAKVLGQLSPLDAKTLAVIDEKEEKELTQQGKFGAVHWDVWDIINEAKKKMGSVPAVEIAASVYNLIRLGMCDQEYPGADGVSITQFGGRLLAAVSPETHWRRSMDSAWWESEAEKRKKNPVMRPGQARN